MDITLFNSFGTNSRDYTRAYVKSFDRQINWADGALPSFTLNMYKLQRLQSLKLPNTLFRNTNIALLFHTTPFFGDVLVNPPFWYN